MGSCDCEAKSCICWKDEIHGDWEAECLLCERGAMIVVNRGRRSDAGVNGSILIEHAEVHDIKVYGLLAGEILLLRNGSRNLPMRSVDVACDGVISRGRNADGAGYL